MKKIDYYKCKICGVKLKGSQRSLSAHLRTNHDLSFKEYYDNFYLTDGENICKYPSCSNETQFYKTSYRTFCLKHAKTYDEDWFNGKYGVEEGPDRYKEHKTKFKNAHKGKSSLDGFIERYGEEEGTKRYKLFLSRCSNSLDGFIERYGEEEGTRLYNDYIKNLSSIRKEQGNLDWFIERYGEEEGTKRYANRNQKISDSKIGTLTLDWFIERYGKEEGTKRYNKRLEKISKSKSGVFGLSWFIERYGEEEGTKRYNKRSLYFSKRGKGVKTKKWYIEKYGKNIGTKKYGEINEKRKESLKGCNTLPFYIKKYGEEIGTKRYKKWKSAVSWIDKSGFTLASKESMEIFFPLIDWILEKKICTLDEIYVGIPNSKEWTLKINSFEKWGFIYDFTIPKLNIIIEYNGEAFHPNPIWLEEDLEKWNAWKHPYSKKSANVIYSQNTKKIQYAKENGFNVLEIWSSTSHIKNIQKCKDFICSLGV